MMGLHLKSKKRRRTSQPPELSEVKTGSVNSSPVIFDLLYIPLFS
jgi:hypothetical protein